MSKNQEQWLGIKRVSIDEASIWWPIDEEQEFKQLIEGAIDSVTQACVCGHWKKDHRHTQERLYCKQCKQCKGFRKQGKHEG